MAIDGDGFKYIGQVGLQPGKGRLFDSKGVLKTRQQYGLVAGVNEPCVKFEESHKVNAT